MPMPKYISKKDHKQWIKAHKKIVKALQKDHIKSPYAVATAKLKKKFKK